MQWRKRSWKNPTRKHFSSVRITLYRSLHTSFLWPYKGVILWNPYWIFFSKRYKILVGLVKFTFKSKTYSSLQSGEKLLLGFRFITLDPLHIHFTPPNRVPWNTKHHPAPYLLCGTRAPSRVLRKADLTDFRRFNSAKPPPLVLTSFSFQWWLVHTYHSQRHQQDGLWTI